jgi:hypothetical protein
MTTKYKVNLMASLTRLWENRQRKRQRRTIVMVGGQRERLKKIHEKPEKIVLSFSPLISCCRQKWEGRDTRFSLERKNNSGKTRHERRTQKKEWRRSRGDSCLGTFRTRNTSKNEKEGQRQAKVKPEERPQLRNIRETGNFWHKIHSVHERLKTTKIMNSGSLPLGLCFVTRKLEEWERKRLHLQSTLRLQS